MGLYEKRFAKSYKAWYDTFGGYVNGLPSADARGLAIDKVGLQHNVKTILDYVVEVSAQLSRQPNYTGDEFTDLSTFLTFGVLLCDYRRWETSPASHPDKMAKILFDSAEFAAECIVQMKARGDYNAAQAWGAISETYLRVLRSSGREEEMIAALQRYAGTQKASANAGSSDAGPQEQNQKFVARMMEDVEPGLAAANLNDPALKASLNEAISALAWEGQKTEDVTLMTLIVAACALCGINDNTELAPELAGEMLFKVTGGVVEYRGRFLENGRPDLERHLSTIAVTQMKILENSPKFEAVMKAVSEAAGEAVRLQDRD